MQLACEPRVLLRRSDSPGLPVQQCISQCVGGLVGDGCRQFQVSRCPAATTRVTPETGLLRQLNGNQVDSHYIQSSMGVARHLQFLHDVFCRVLTVVTGDIAACII
jgi:hypothetical protein